MHLPLQGTSPTCALWGSRTVCGPEQLYRGARGASLPRLVTTLMPDGGRARVFDFGTEWGDLSAAVWVSIAVCSSQYPSSCREYADRRVRVRGCGAWPWAVGGRRSRGAARNEEAKYVFFTHLYHTQKSEPATRSGNRAPSLLSSVPSRLQSPKSSERAQSPISRRAPSTGARVPVGRLGRPVPVF